MENKKSKKILKNSLFESVFHNETTCIIFLRKIITVFNLSKFVERGIYLMIEFWEVSTSRQNSSTRML
jgi:hypothetical protein